jgi:hypothetical protein
MRHRRMNRLYAYQGNIPSFNSAVKQLNQAKQRIAALILTSTMALMLIACGLPIAPLKAAIAAFTPVIQILVDQHKITPAQRDIYTADTNKLLDAFGVLAGDFNAAKTKVDKFEAVRKFANTVSPIVGDFANVPQLGTAVVILNATISTVEAFYSSAPAASPTAPKTERELADYVKKQSAAMKAVLGTK